VQFQVIDTYAAYRRLLEAPDAETREAVFRAELVAPFEGLARVFGGDGMASFRQWGMAPEQFAPESRERFAGAMRALAGHRAWERATAALERGREAFAGYAERIPLEQVVFGLLLADMRHVPGQRGYSGFGAIPGWIMTIYDTPDEYNLARVEAATVHELHHNIYGAAFPERPMIATVGAYMVGEGLAESFAAELYGEESVGYYVTDFDEAGLDEVRARFRDALTLGGFDTVRAYIFGDAVAESMGMPPAGVPPYAGYALGYRVVQEYLRRTGKRVAEATFTPAEEIIAESRFFG
jgi:uncharacterized protein YjaZ